MKNRKRQNPVDYSINKIGYHYCKLVQRHGLTNEEIKAKLDAWLKNNQEPKNN